MSLRKRNDEKEQLDVGEMEMESLAGGWGQKGLVVWEVLERSRGKT